MTTATTQTTLKLLEVVTGSEENPVFQPGTVNRVYQSVDGHFFAVSSWVDTDEDYTANVVAWPARDATGEPTMEYGVTYALPHMLGMGDLPHVDGPDTDETHAAALALLGFAVAAEQEDAA